MWKEWFSVSIHIASFFNPCFTIPMLCLVSLLPHPKPLGNLCPCVLRRNIDICKK